MSEYSEHELNSNKRMKAAISYEVAAFFCAFV